VVKQIHEQDCYGRLGPAGGIRAVVPFARHRHLQHHGDTGRTHDSTITTHPTPLKAIDYYDDQLTDLKSQLMNRSGDEKKVD